MTVKQARTGVVPADPVINQAAAIIQVIERAAINPNVDIDKMERLLEMQERIMARDAKSAFSSAMSDAQSQVRPVAADATNPQTRSKYATYAALDRAVRPIYVQHGFALSFNTTDGAADDHIRLTCNVMHRDGHSELYRVDMPADGKGAKGGDVMTKTHAAGAAMSYGQRYLLKLIFNIAVGEDDDGNHGAGPVITDDQADEIRRRIDQTKSLIGPFLQYFGAASVADIPASKYAAVIAALDKKAKEAA